MNHQVNEKTAFTQRKTRLVNALFLGICFATQVLIPRNGLIAKPPDGLIAHAFSSAATESAGLLLVRDKPKRKPVKRPAARKTRFRLAARSNPPKRPTVNRKTASLTGTKKAAARPQKGPMVLTVPLFGPKYARVAIRDQQLKGVIIYLSSGHGGPDPGAIGRSGTYLLPEDEYAYDVTIRLARVLMEHSATVYMIVQDTNDGIRDTGILGLDYDEVAYPHQTIPLSQLARLRQGTTAVNNLYARHKKAYQRSVVIHVDSRSIGQNIDVFFYHHDRSPAGKQLAGHIHRTFTARYKRSQPGRAYLGTVSTRNTLYVVKNTTPPTVFIELGNIQNDKDQRRFVIPDNRQALANWLYEGIRADYKSR